MKSIKCQIQLSIVLYFTSHSTLQPRWLSKTLLFLETADFVSLLILFTERSKSTFENSLRTLLREKDALLNMEQRYLCKNGMIWNLPWTKWIISWANFVQETPREERTLPDFTDPYSRDNRSLSYQDHHQHQKQQQHPPPLQQQEISHHTLKSEAEAEDIETLTLLSLEDLAKDDQLVEFLM